ncbi:unnamed protein product [Victoria cruziana]
MSGLGTPDFFYREAQRLGYVARSAFKLLQMQKQYKLISPGDSILDLGCAPGAWLQVACQSLGPLKNGGAVVGIDLKKVKVPSAHCDSRVQAVSADVMKLPREKVMELSPKGRGFSVILCDMCPSVSGITMKDTILSGELATRALILAIGSGRLSGLDDYSFLFDSEDAPTADSDAGVLLPRGNLVIKLLESEENQSKLFSCGVFFSSTIVVFTIILCSQFAYRI